MPTKAVPNISIRLNANVKLTNLQVRSDDAVSFFIKSALDELKNDVINNRSLDKRISSWQKLSDRIDDIYYTQGKRKLYSEGTGRLLRGFMQQLMRDKGIKVDDMHSLVDFLKKFPKIEAVYVQNLFVQAFTNPDKDNKIFYNSSEYFSLKEGDCTDVAWFNYDILRSIGVDAKLLEISFDMKFIVEKNVGHHAAVNYNCAGKGKQYSGLIDNYSVYSFKKKKLLKMSVHDVFPQAMDYREIDVNIWKDCRYEKDDLTRLNPNKSISIRIVTKKRAIEVIGTKISLESLFDNPNDDILYFKYRADRIILKSDLPFEEKEKIYNFYFLTGNRIKSLK